MTSTVPAVLQALQGLAAALNSGPAYIGSPVTRQPGDFISVGWSGPDNPAVSAVEPRVGAARQMESYDVAVQLVATQGDSNLLDCITRVYAVHDQFVAALLADQTIGGMCMQAAVSDSSLAPDQTTDGSIATLTLTVSVSNFLR